MAPLQLEIQLTTANFLRQPVTPDQRGIPLPDAKERGIGGNGQVIPVLKQNSSFQRCPPDYILSTLMKLLISLTTSSLPILPRARCIAFSGA